MPHKDPDARRQYQREYQSGWRRRNPEKRAEILRRSDALRGPQRKAQLSEVRFRRYHRTKLAALDMYGTSCVFCGESKYELLTIDHVLNDGAAHRRSAEYRKLSLGGMFGYLCRTPYRPDLYRVLCHNCNAARYHYGIEPGGDSYRPVEEWRSLSALRRKS